MPPALFSPSKNALYICKYKVICPSRLPVGSLCQYEHRFHLMPKFARVLRRGLAPEAGRRGVLR